MQKTRTSFYCNLVLSLIAFFIFLKAMNKVEVWRMVLAGAGFDFFVLLIIVLFNSMKT